MPKAFGVSIVFSHQYGVMNELDLIYRGFTSGQQ